MTKLCYLSDANSSHTHKWVDYFSKSYDEIHLISMRETSHKYDSNVKLHIINPPFKSKLSYFFIINKIKYLIKQINPDLIHSHYATSYGLYGRLSNYHPFIISVWGSDVYDFPKSSKLKSSLLKYILSGADVICSTSHDMANEIRKYYDKKTIKITPFGVDTDKFDISTSILSNSYITIGVCKHLTKIYGINYLLESFALLIQEVDKDIRLLIVGDGVERKSLESLAEKLEISDKVTFEGAIENNDVPIYMNKMDIVCLPSIMESFGVSALEAEACGRPVICSDVGGLKEVVLNNETGYIFKSEDIIDLKNKLKSLITDEETMKFFSSNARKFVLDNYSWEDSCNNMNDIYLKMMQK